MTKEVIETHVAENAIRIIEIIIINTIKTVHYTMEKMEKLYVTSTNFRKAGFSNNHKRPFYITV